MKVKISTILVLAAMASMSAAHYSGPFLMWGLDNLNSMKIPTLQPIDDSALRDIYARASAIVIFIRNATTKLSYENFPELSDIIGKSEWLYLPQETLTSDPLEYNVNAEVFTLTGPVMMQDNEIAAFYRDAQINYGNKNVLGIVAARSDSTEHVILKRAADTTESSSETPPTAAPDEPVENLVYAVANKAIIYTNVVPKLNITVGSKVIEYELRKHTHPTHDERNDLKLIVKYILPERTPIYLKFVFRISAGSWSMGQIELEDPSKKGVEVLNVLGRAPSAPMSNWSFVCSDTIYFKSNSSILVLKNIQVQPFPNGTVLGKPYDCYGATTPGILAGVFVVAIMAIVLSIALTAIMDIRTPNRFESRSSKQLTFTVQE